MRPSVIAPLVPAVLGLCLVAGCCCGGDFAEEFQQGFEEGLAEGLEEASEASSAESDAIDTSTSWGTLKATRDTKVFETPSVHATVVARVKMREEVEYFGFDDSFEFYKVVTSDGTEGYLPIKDAEIKIG